MAGAPGGRDDGPAPGPFLSRPRYPAAGPNQAGPFPPAPDPAALFPVSPGPARAGNPPRRAQPGRERRARAGLLIGAACVAVLVLAALAFLVA